MFYGYWASLAHFRAAHPGFNARRCLALVAMGQARITKPKLYAHQTAELDHMGRWIVKMIDQKRCAQILPVPNPVSLETAKQFNRNLPRCGNYNNI